MGITPDQHFARIEREQERAARGPRIPSGGPNEPIGDATPEKLRALLREVIDPELGVDIVELGLLRDVKIENGVVDVTYTVTTPTCPLSEYIEDEIRSAISWLPDVRRINIELVLEPAWTPEEMSEKARAKLGWTG
ncbi:MAG: metal-sulfur cluster assembly factor [Actinobacteria bacterium]|nr:metal-sulfur cluster assembly factor [Actinomycetota bacterium]